MQLILAALIALLCVVPPCLADVADNNHEQKRQATDGKHLVVLEDVVVPYQELPALDYDMPVMSLSQRFSDLDESTWVETAVPIPVPTDRQWDIRAMRFDVTVGRRTRAGDGGVFAFDWAGNDLLRHYGGRLHVYASCPSNTHASGKPCATPSAVYTVEFDDDDDNDNDALEQIASGSWGRVFRATAFLSRNPDVPGFVARERVWIAFFAQMPSVYRDAATGTEYELRHWFPVWSSHNETTDLAIADHADLLERGWKDWRHGQELKDSLYQGVAYPSPAFSVVGYDEPLSAVGPTSPADQPPSETNHWPGGLPPVQAPAPQKPAGAATASPSGLSGADIAIIASVGGGLFLLLCLIAFFFVKGLMRRRRRAREAKEQSERLIEKIGHEQENLIIDDEGAFSSEHGRGLGFRKGTDSASASPMLHNNGDGAAAAADDDDDDNNPYAPQRKPRGALRGVDDEDDDFE